MPDCLSFIGFHNSGKTTLILKVVDELVSRGYSIGVVKSTKHSICTRDDEGTDTWRFREGGVERIALVCPEGIVHFRQKKAFSLPYEAFSMFSGCDLVIAEGFKGEKGVKKIEVARQDVSKRLLKDEVDGVVAVVSDFPVKGIRSFGHSDIHGLCDFIEAHFRLLQKKERFDIELFVDERRIPLKRFVRDSLMNTVAGYVSSLKFTEGAKSIEMRIRFGAKNRIE